MNEKFEIEYKTLIDNPTAYRLLALGIFNYSGKQLNKYYDTVDNELQAKKIVFRIREKEKSFLFTAKRQSESGLKETEFRVDSFNPKHESIDELKKIHEITSDLNEIGSTLTYRYTYNDSYGEWCLDFNVFTNSSDIELEYELKDGVFNKEDYFESQLKKWDVPLNPCPSKFVRMLNDRE